MRKTKLMMTKYFSGFSRILLAGLLLFTFGCERDLEELELATFPTAGDVFIDGFTGGMEYRAFGVSDVTAFNTDTDVTYRGTTSMRFAVPDANSPNGSFAGGAFILGSGRDLSGFNVLTFWARASQPVTVGEVGFGNYFGDNEHVTTLRNVDLTSNWQKFYIPIPDPAKLTQERGMLYYAAAPENDRGYTFWIDEVRFENLGTITRGPAVVFGGGNDALTTEVGAVITTGGTATFNLPQGVNQNVDFAPAYFDFNYSDPSVATTNELGLITVTGAGTTEVTATLAGEPATGMLTINSTGEAVRPTTPAPTPMESADDVISLYSNVYENEPLDFLNGFWEFSTTQSEEIQVDGDDIFRYSQLNFVGIQFTSPTINITPTNRIHLDIWTPDVIEAGSEFKILLVDLGPDNSFDGTDGSSHEITIPASMLSSQEWITLDLPLTDFPGLTTRANLAQIVLSGNLPNIYMDNLYFYDGEPGTGGGDDEPTVGAPTPSQNPADVISLFSDAYTDVTVDTWRTDWSVADFMDVLVAGNATKRYTNLSFVGVETTTNTVDVSGMTHFRVDAWTPDATVFKIKLVDFGADGVFNESGGDDVEHEITFNAPATNQWISYDIPLSDFTGLVTRSNMAQYIFSAEPAGGATVFLDNVYFYNDDGMTGGGDEPTMAAPTPSDAAANVISIFSDAYPDVNVDTYRTDWSVGDLEDVMVAGNATKKYSNLSFVGIETTTNTVDATAMTHFRVDIWSPDATVFKIKLVDFGADGVFNESGGDDVEHEITFNAPATNQWISYDIPLSDFTGLTTRSNIAQYILVAEPTGNSTVFMDNMYFRN